jgi:transposase
LNCWMSFHVESCAMNWIEGTDRSQIRLLPPCIEDYVGPDNPVRFLDAFVSQLDLRALGFILPKENSQDRGRPAYQRGDLLKLYLYGYLRRVRSSRRLERECVCNLEVIWLLGELKPDFKTIADFRKDNAQAFKQVVRQFNKVCQSLELFGGELLAIDGTKMKGQNSPGKNWSLSKLEKQQAKLEERLAEYLKALEEADRQDQGQAPALSAAELAQKIAQLKERRGQIQEQVQAMEKLGQTQLSATDPESRSMKGAHGYVVGYNVQGAVDAKHHLLAATAVTNSGFDHGQLAPMAQAAKEQLQIEKGQVVADGGYFVAMDIKSCQEMGMEPHLAQLNNSPSERAGLYGKKDFTYEPATDSYLCPAGQRLTKRREVIDKGRLIFNYENPKACQHCALKSRCTKVASRTVSRWEHEPVLERMAAQVAARPQTLVRRKTLIEHCWGTFKWLMPEGFLLKGIKKVQAEVSLAHFAYNFKRALKIIGVTKLLEALGKGHGPQEPSPGPSTAENATKILSKWLFGGNAFDLARA